MKGQATITRIHRRLANSRLSRDKCGQTPFRAIIRISGGDHASRKDRTDRRIRLSPMERSLARHGYGPSRRGGENPPVLRSPDRELGLHAGGEEGSREEPRQILPAGDHAFRRYPADDYRASRGPPSIPRPPPP